MSKILLISALFLFVGCSAFGTVSVFFKSDDAIVFEHLRETVTSEHLLQQAKKHCALYNKETLIYKTWQKSNDNIVTEFRCY
ncbi:MAG: hypothetical protein KAJ75_02915 [Alphaproteobacteria bacterium]|nr:hypothetical protein [Alphaproteobacteria bacterium]